MSWLNLNQSLNSLKGQITNFASEVLSESVVQESEDGGAGRGPGVEDLQEICRSQELEIESLKKSVEELQTSLQAERLSGKNGVRDEESSWYWDPSPQTSQSNEKENMYKDQIQRLQNEVSSLKERELAQVKLETENELHRLREENRNLMNNLEDLDSQHQLAMERLLTLKSELQKNFEVLKQDHLDLKSTNERYESEIKILSEKLKDRDRDVDGMVTIKADHETLQNKYQNLERIHSLLRENAEKFQEENQELHEEVFKLQEQVTKLEHDLEMAFKTNMLSNTVPKEHYEELLQQLNDLKHRRTIDHDQLDAINIDDNAKSVIETLKRDINNLKDKLTSKESIQEQIEHKTVKSEKIMLLYNKYVNFELPVDYVGEMPASDDGVILYKLESVFKTVNSFKKEIDVLEHKLSEKNLNISHLQTQIDDITTENDFLTTDLQHLERELNEMKKNNDFLISEIAALKNTSKLEPIIETHEDNIVKLETELADSNRINKTFESKIKTIETELANVTSEKVNIQNSLHDLKEKYSSMLNEFEEYKNQTKAVEELEQNVNLETTDNLKKAIDEIDELKKRLNAASAKNEQLTIDLHIIDNDKVLLTKEVDELKQYLDKMSSEYNELEVLKFSLERKLQETENVLDETIRRKKEIETDRLNLHQKISVLEKQLASKESESLLHKNLDSLYIEKSELTNKLNDTLRENDVLNEKINNKTIESENLKLENESLKTSNYKLQENIASLQISMKNVSEKHNEEELLKELSTLKDDNHSLLERKLQIETELVATDGKIVHLEQEFERILSQLNEKDNIIETLNSTVVQNNVALANLNQNVTDLENTLIIKNNEIERLNLSTEELNGRLNTTSQNFIEVQEEMIRISNEKEIINKQITNINEELMTKDEEILKLQTKIQDLENNISEWKAIIDSKDKEIKELNQSIVELSDKIITTDNTSHHNDEYAKLVQEKEASENEVIELKSKLTANEQDVKKLKLTLESYEKSYSECQVALNNSNTEKVELINLVNLKHNESIQYHNEIQRLNQVLLEQTNEMKKLVNENDCLVQNQSMNCSHCESLQITLKEKDEIIIALNKNMSEYERVKAELFNATESVQNLTDKCESLNKSLGIQLETVKKLSAENVQLSEQDQNLTRELERLRAHLMETEENYTQELMASEQKLTECQTRLYQVEERAKQTSTVYTSNSIRANQEVETLRNQIKLLEKQREEVQSRLSEAEDARSRSEAALINLQVVLEQFQLDKERDIQISTEKIRNQMEELKCLNNELKEDITRLNSKLENALAGLQAASRLGDQVETKTAQINDLKEQVRTLQTSVAASEERYYNTISNQQDKVDKNLVKNLIINYVVNSTQNAANKTQVLRVLSTVLDFNQKECERLGLVRAPAGDSLAVEFVRFLQQESRPRAALPSMLGIADSSRSTTPVSRKNSTLGPNPVFEPGHKRNPSTGSNNLLFQNIDNIETMSQRSGDSEREPKVIPITQMPVGVNQTRNTEGAILKHVLNDTEYK